MRGRRQCRSGGGRGSHLAALAPGVADGGLLGCLRLIDGSRGRLARDGYLAHLGHPLGGGGGGGSALAGGRVLGDERRVGARHAEVLVRREVRLHLDGPAGAQRRIHPLHSDDRDVEIGLASLDLARQAVFALRKAGTLAGHENLGVRVEVARDLHPTQRERQLVKVTPLAAGDGDLERLR